MDISNVIDYKQVSSLESKSETKSNDLDEKELFKQVFVEQMVQELLKTASYLQEDNDIQKDLIKDQFVEALSDEIMDYSDVEWEKVMGLYKETKK